MQTFEIDTERKVIKVDVDMNHPLECVDVINRDIDGDVIVSMVSVA